ncbi:hypothetical protein KZB11_25135, partial [Escherichia coli]|nr:hypothetical protein [Escherichia coli]
VPAYGPQNDVTLKMPAFEWVHVQLHQQKGMISLSPPTICNSADNSSSNYDNSRNGNRRLIYSANGSRTFAGYYVIANNGTTNFFSTSGKRMFYTPKGGRGVYGGKDGSFCGALVVINGQFSLALTDNGLKIMYLSN